jgi:calcineurin-like phosphoesterase
MLPGGTAYMTDAGMTGDYDSIIGMQKEEPLHRFTTGRFRAGLRRCNTERRRGRNR